MIGRQSRRTLSCRPSQGVDDTLGRTSGVLCLPWVRVDFPSHSPRVEFHVHEVAVHVTSKQRCTHEVRYAEFIHLDNRDKRANNAKTHVRERARSVRMPCVPSPQRPMQSSSGASPRTTSKAHGPWPPCAKARRRQHNGGSVVRHTRDGMNRNARRHYAAGVRKRKFY